MNKTLALIHTSKVFLTVETMMQELFAEILPDVRLINILDDSLLPDCIAAQSVPTAVTRRMCAYVMAAGMAGADAVLSLCSSLGPAVDVARKLVSIPVLKIDDAHTAMAVARARRIGILATASTTLKPTAALLLEKAAAANREVELHESLCASAFELLMAGRKDEHDARLLNAARELAPQVDVILLAQASMTRLAPAIEQAGGRPVLSSPRPAIELARRVLMGDSGF